MRLVFEYMGLNHTFDTIDDSLSEAERFRQAVVDSYINIAAGDYQRHTPVMGNTQRRSEREGRWVKEMQEADSRRLGDALAGKSNLQPGIKK